MELDRYIERDTQRKGHRETNRERRTHKERERERERETIPVPQTAAGPGWV